MFFVQDFFSVLWLCQSNKKILHLLTNDSSPMALDRYSCNNTAAIKIFALISFVVVVTSFSMIAIGVYSGKYLFLQESSNSVDMC